MTCSSWCLFGSGCLLPHTVHRVFPGAQELHALQVDRREIAAIAALGIDRAAYRTAVKYEAQKLVSGDLVELSVAGALLLAHPAYLCPHTLAVAVQDCSWRWPATPCTQTEL